MSGSEIGKRVRLPVWQHTSQRSTCPALGARKRRIVAGTLADRALPSMDRRAHARALGARKGPASKRARTHEPAPQQPRWCGSSSHIRPQHASRRRGRHGSWWENTNTKESTARKRGHDSSSDCATVRLGPVAPPRRAADPLRRRSGWRSRTAGCGFRCRRSASSAGGRRRRSRSTSRASAASPRTRSSAWTGARPRARMLRGSAGGRIPARYRHTLPPLCLLRAHFMC